MLFSSVASQPFDDNTKASSGGLKNTEGDFEPEKSGHILTWGL